MVLTNIDLDWSLWPLTAWFRLTTGASLQEQNGNGKIKFRPFVFLTVNIVSHVFIIRQFFYDIVPAIQFVKPNDLLTTTRMWNTATDYINWTFATLTAHLLLVFIVRPRWSNLIRLYRCSTALLGLRFYTSLRRLSVFGISYIFLFNGGPILIMSWNYWTHYVESIQTKRLNIYIINCSQVLFHMHLTTSLVLFCICGQASAYIFKSIEHQIRSDVDDAFVLKILLHRYHIACETVDAINSCFGSICLIATPYCFVGLINVSFMIFGSLETVAVAEIFLFVSYITHLAVICLTSDNIRHKADGLLPEIRRLPLDLEGDSQNELARAFLSQVGQSSAQVTACGLFDISRRLILQLIGAALTYFFILYQFQASEM